MLIYVVMGTTGEYSDHSEWPVAAYTDKALAERHVLLASEKANEIKVLRDRQEYPRPDYHNPYDSDMWMMDYTGTDYFIYEVPLIDSLPDVPADFALFDAS